MANEQSNGLNPGGAAAAPAFPPLPAEVLGALSRYDAPTVANAIETFNVRPRNTGFMRPEIRCIFPSLRVMVGYAVTAKIRADRPAAPGEGVPNFTWWDFIEKIPRPRVIVIEDIDDPPCVGSFWGEVQSNIHRALGCVGTVTNGGVRDLNEVEPLGFHFFAQNVIVSHAYVHMVEFGGPVRIGGLTVRTGDLIHADRHGVQTVPHDIAGRVASAADRIFAREHKIIDCCKSPDFSLDDLKDVFRSLTEHH